MTANTSAENYEGHCQCGAVRFRAEGKPKWVLHCHCEDCRRSTASPFTTFAGFEKGRFAWTGDVPALFESSPHVFRRFCATCGTAMTYESDRWPTETHIFVATLTDPNALEPTGHVFVSDKLEWIHLADGLPQHSKTSG